MNYDAPVVKVVTLEAAGAVNVASPAGQMVNRDGDYGDYSPFDEI